jgi:hypothetical protein
MRQIVGIARNPRSSALPPLRFAPGCSQGGEELGRLLTLKVPGSPPQGETQRCIKRVRAMTFVQATTFLCGVLAQPIRSRAIAQTSSGECGPDTLVISRTSSMPPGWLSPCVSRTMR